MIKNKETGHWQLFNLKEDPRETSNLSDRNPRVIEEMLDEYNQFVATLPPLKPSADYSGGGQVPKGWGWEIGDGNAP